MFSLPALTQLLTRHTPFETVAVRRWEVHPATETVTAPAFFLHNTLDRITGLWTGVVDDYTWQLERERIYGGTAKHRATEALEFKDVKLHGGFLYAGGAKSQLEPHRQALKPMRDDAPHLAQAALACTLIGNRYFGHFLVDDLPINVLAQRFAPPIRTHQVRSAHQLQYCDRLGVHAQAHESAHIESLLTFIDFGQNAYKRERYLSFRETLLKDYAPSGHRGAMILRGNTGVPRKMVNESAIAEYLAGIGFAIIEPSMSLDQILGTLSGVEMVVGVEGSHLLHALWTMSETGTMLVLQPPYRFNNVNKNYTDCIGQKYGFVIGQPDGDGFVIDLDELKQVLDMAS